MPTPSAQAPPLLYSQLASTALAQVLVNINNSSDSVASKGSTFVLFGLGTKGNHCKYAKPLFCTADSQTINWWLKQLILWQWEKECIPWSVAKQSMMSMFSQRASWSSWLTKQGRTSPQPAPSLAASSSVRKRWWGQTSQVTACPWLFAALMIRICKNAIWKQHQKLHSYWGTAVNKTHVDHFHTNRIVVIATISPSPSREQQQLPWQYSKAHAYLFFASHMSDVNRALCQMSQQDDGCHRLTLGMSN